MVEVKGMFVVEVCSVIVELCSVVVEVCSVVVVVRGGVQWPQGNSVPDHLKA